MIRSSEKDGLLWTTLVLLYLKLAGDEGLGSFEVNDLALLLKPEVLIG